MTVGKWRPITGLRRRSRRSALALWPVSSGGGHRANWFGRCSHFCERAHRVCLSTWLSRHPCDSRVARGWEGEFMRYFLGLLGSVTALVALQPLHAMAAPCCSPPPITPQHYGPNDAANTGLIVLQQAPPPDLPAGANAVPTTGSWSGDIEAQNSSTFAWANPGKALWPDLWAMRTDVPNPPHLLDDTNDVFLGPDGHNASQEFTTVDRAIAATLALEAAELADHGKAQNIAINAGLLLLHCLRGPRSWAKRPVHTRQAQRSCSPGGLFFHSRLREWLHPRERYDTGHHRCRNTSSARQR